MVLSVALTMGLTGCGSSSKKSGEIEVAQTGDVLFEAGLQFVKIEPRDAPGVSNEHPVPITAEDMRTVLKSVYVQESTLFNDRQAPMFSPGEVQILGTTLSSGFGRVDSTQDLTFVMLGVHPGLVGKERLTNSGRVFVSGGRLNIVFGKAHEEFREKDRYTGQEIDRRINPLLPGTRKSEADLTVPLVLDQGQSYYVDPDTGKERRDWLVIDVATVLAVAAEREQEAGDQFISAELKEDIAQNKQDAKNLREDMANIKEVLFEMSDKLEQMSRDMDALKAKQ
jgi:hypothetical protein